MLALPKSSPQVCSHVSVFFLFTNNGGHPQSTLVSGSLLVVEEDEDGENDETDGKGRGAYGRVLTLEMD